MAEPAEERDATPRGVSLWLGDTARLVVVIFGGCAAAGLMILSMVDATLRTTIDRPVFGAADISSALLVVVVACAIPASVLGGRDVAVDTLVMRLSMRSRRALALLTNALAALLLGFLAWRAGVNAGEAASFGERSPLLRIPFGPLYWALAAGSGLAALVFAWRLLAPPRT